MLCGNFGIGVGTGRVAAVGVLKSWFLQGEQAVSGSGHLVLPQEAHAMGKIACGEKDGFEESKIARSIAEKVFKMSRPERGDVGTLSFPFLAF
jgi:hypothetical protein